MAFYTKYDMSFKSVHGVPISVEIQVDGYIGDPIVRRLGAAPVLKTQKNGRIISTSIEFLAECLVWGEFAEFYTQDPRRFQVFVGRGDDGEGETRLIWRGYVTPEIYSEPYISAPYDVRICANDGLGELKLYDWESVGRQTIAQTLATLLEAAGAEYSYIYSVSALRPASGQVSDFYDSVYIDLDYLAGKSYYDVLQSLLESINADIMQYGGDWVLIRETDAIPKVIFPYTTAVSLEAVCVSTLGSYTSNLYGVVNTIGQMGVADLWPVGYMTRSVEPAKKKLIVSAPWHFANAFDDPDMVDANAWSLSGLASIGDGITLGRMNVGASLGQASQTFTLQRFTKSIKVSIKALAQWVSTSYLDGKTRGVGVWARYQVTRTSEIKYFCPRGNNTEWGSSYSEPDVQKVDERDFSGVPRRPHSKELSFDIPAPGVNEEVFLQIGIIGYGVIAVGASAIVDDNKGYQDTLIIDNGARGDESNVEITGGRMTGDNVIAERFYEGLLVDRYGAAQYSFSDGAQTGKDFLSINALNRAVSVAVPRLKISGKFNVPESMVRQPIILRDGTGDLLVKSFEWDLYNDEIQIEATMLPVATLEVASETITSL